MQCCNTSAPLLEAINVLSWVNLLATVNAHPLVRYSLAGAKRILGISSQDGEERTVTPEILARLLDKFAPPEASIANICTLAVCLISYTGFFPF